jgi:hypothetical protein
MFELHMKRINGFRATILKTKPNFRRYYNANPIPFQIKIEALTLYTNHPSLAWAPARAGHPYQRVCLAFLGSLGGGWPKSATFMHRGVV